jgi:hypothetical protein
VVSLSSTHFRAMRGVQAYTRDALQLHRPDLGEGHLDPAEASTTSCVKRTSPGRAYSAIREARFTVRP